MSADVTARLDKLEAAHRAATPGPWVNDGSEIYQVFPGLAQAVNAGEWIGETCRLNEDPLGPGDADADAIVAAHNATPALITAVRGVLALADAIDYEAEWLDSPSRPTKRAVAADLRSVVSDALSVREPTP